MSRLCELTMHEARARIEQGGCDPRELLRDVLDQIERLNPLLHAYIAVDRRRLEAALDARLRQGPRGRLFGIPVTVKDNLCVQDEETACGSRILAGFRPPYHATAIDRLLQEGAVIIPRANMDEFAFGSSTETSYFGPTKNPWDPARVPGGSSGGSATAVAADLALGALGTDTGGSIRQPASFCGVVGLKPTYGRVSRYGLIAFASSLDQIGPITKDVTDCALLLSVIAGHDPKDSTSAPVDVPDYVGRLSAPIRGFRIGVPNLPKEGLDEQVGRAIEEATQVFQRLGCSTVPVDLPHIGSSIATYYVVAVAEASSNLARYDGVQYGYRATEPGYPRGFVWRSQTCGGGRRECREPGGERPPTHTLSLLDMYERTRDEGFGAEAKRRIILGTYVLSRGYYDAYYLQGMKVRTLIKRDFDEAFQRCDAVVLPTSPTPAFRLGEKLDDPLQMYLSDIYTISANLAGVPAISIPCGSSREGLPIGMQLVAAPFGEEALLRAAFAYEQATEWHHQTPAIKGSDPVGQSHGS
ncbi:MAG: Asp-tRNA(Asn)/Glu-tRNA(Gln) amidotransferase subunit GatA [Candidatus Omnitrophica bacterium]|nr:Asp-tRNA(Asn)/Glu-tRNA(Gln) amidotransferase subunit GatA [Candidatus Omnitrophota bacterium]